VAMAPDPGVEEGFSLRPATIRSPCRAPQWA
jgi:hypothetical protein